MLYDRRIRKCFYLYIKSYHRQVAFIPGLEIRHVLQLSCEFWYAE